MTDPRDLIQRLADALAAHHQLPGRVPLITEARAYLATPEPAAGPTDEELLSVDDLCGSWNAQADAANSWDELAMDEIIWFAQQQALARWGHQPPQPIPLSERLPGPEDCDAEGRCWLLGKIERDWRLISATNPGIPKLTYVFSHWLPHRALPLPEPHGQD